MRGGIRVHLKLVGLTNMFSNRSPSGRAKAFTAIVFSVMMKCDMVSDASALDSHLHSTMVTSDVRLLHQPITIFITNETTAMTTERVLRPKDSFTVIAHNFTFISSPRTR